MHFEKVKQYAAHFGYTVFLDPFPGYWNTMMFLEDWGIDYEAEILRRWALADRQEYIGGETRFFNYNISETSTSYSVELGQLGYDGVLDNRSSIAYYYYDIGEPQIIQGGRTYNGSFVYKLVDEVEPLTFTRADINTSTSQTNYLDAAILNDSTSVFNLQTRFSVEPGKTVWLNGLCKVIQPEEVTFVPERESFIMGDRIAKVRYTVKNAAGVVQYTRDEDVGLTRVFDGGRSSTSILEFRHGFTFSEADRGNDFFIFAQALNENGEAVGGMEVAAVIRVPR